jgi:hypothetical protein
MTRSTADVAHSFTSPLAQIFQPLVVADEEAVLDDGTEGQAVQNPSIPVLSYGPATRRRLSSTHRQGAKFGDYPSPQLQPPLQDQPGHLRPIFSAPRSPSSSQGGSITAGPFSQSPPQDDEPETVEQVSDDRAHKGGETMLAKRLERMEERQKKIEDLLVSLANDLRSQQQ